MAATEALDRYPASELPKSTTSIDSFTVTPPVTPNATSTSAHQLFSEIRSIYDTLRTLPSLVPSEQVNALLTRLVNLCIIPYSQEFISHFFRIPGVEALCEQLRPLCSTAEGELEQYWAEKMVGELSSTKPTSPRTILTTFPYYTNYTHLSRLEFSAVSAFLPTAPSSIAFIGSGPLPLSSLCFLDSHPNATVHNIDRDAAALSVSAELCSKLGYGGMTFSCEDVMIEGSGCGKDAWETFDVVFLAALVGNDTHSKLSILGSLARKLRKGALVVARSARGVRGVLYPVLQLCEDLQTMGLEVLAEVHPWTEVVNSVVVLRVK